MASEGTKYLDCNRLKQPKYRQQVIERLIQEYKDEIYRYCVNMLGSVYGEDIAQEVFITAWEKLETYREDAQIGGWLKGIAKNKCMQFFRNRYRRANLMECWVEDIRNNVHGNEHLSAEDQQVALLN
ncbi:MAG: RNA polymerase sigma factor [Methylococcaceae bacterium]